MSTIIYLIRHSEPFKIHRGITITNESLLIENEKTPLSINGEEFAKQKSNLLEFNDLDEVWSSNYVRSMSTAKYFAYKNNLKVNINDDFNERVHGVNSWDVLPVDYEKKQFNDELYKLENGENAKEVRERMYNALINVVNNNRNKKVLIVSHATAIAFLLSYWCKVMYGGDYTFNGVPFFDGKWNYLETFKLEFDDDNNLLNIINIK